MYLRRSPASLVRAYVSLHDLFLYRYRLGANCPPYPKAGYIRYSCQLLLIRRVVKQERRYIFQMVVGGARVRKIVKFSARFARKIENCVCYIVVL